MIFPISNMLEGRRHEKPLFGVPGSKNKTKEVPLWYKNISNYASPNELKQQQRAYDILSVFVQNGLFDFNLAALDNEGIVNTKDQKLISLYNELITMIKDNRNLLYPSVLTKLYETFSNKEVLEKSLHFSNYLINQGYNFSTVDDLDVSKDEVTKLKKDFDSLPQSEPPTLDTSSDRRNPFSGRKYYTKKTPEQKKQDIIDTTTKYLKDLLKLDDNEIKSRIELLFSPVGTEKPNSSNDTNYWRSTSTTLNEQILREFKRFI
jgi:hypothetical protein